MKVLVDESLPIAFAAESRGHEVTTVRTQRWLGLKNGVLLRAAVDAGFEVLVTADKALRHQQNLAAIGIGVVLIADLRPLVPRVLAAIATVRKGEIVIITGLAAPV